MQPQIITINLTGVNCYLLKTGTNYVLVDTGFSNKRAFLEKRLKDLGCLPGDLKLIILTHGDMDHVGNAAYLREKFGAKIAIHADDAGMVERGNAGWNRKAKSDRVSPIFKIMIFIFVLFSSSVKQEVFKPDFYIDESFNFSTYGLDAKIVHLPGHSKGSISVLTSGGGLICGDFIYNMAGFGLINDLVAHRSSLEKVKRLSVKMVYPGHGKPISIERFIKKYQD